MTTQKACPQGRRLKWQGMIAKDAYPETWRSLWQIGNSLIPFLVMWYLMYRGLELGYWLTLLLAIPAAGFMVRSRREIGESSQSSPASM